MPLGLHLRGAQLSSSVFAAHIGVGFDLDQVLVAHERGTDERIGGLNRRETRTVRTGDGFPIGDVPDIDARTDEDRKSVV